MLKHFIAVQVSIPVKNGGSGTQETMIAGPEVRNRWL